MARTDVGGFVVIEIWFSSPVAYIELLEPLFTEIHLHFIDFHYFLMARVIASTVLVDCGNEIVLLTLDVYRGPPNCQVHVLWFNLIITCILATACSVWKYPDTDFSTGFNPISRISIVVSVWLAGCTQLVKSQLYSERTPFMDWTWRVDHIIGVIVIPIRISAGSRYNSL